MAKKSAINRDQKRRKLVAKFANKRAKLKAATKDQSLSMEERFQAQLKLATIAARFPAAARLITGSCACRVSPFVTLRRAGRSPAW